VTNVHGKLTNEDYVRDNQFTIEPRDKIFIGVASVEKSSNLKGGLILKEIEKLLDQEKVNAEVLYLSDLASSSGSSNSFWTLIDYLLVPSVLDNSPNVIHEAKILGIPVIATEVGGIGELLNSQYDYSVELNENTHHVVVEIIKKILSEKPKIHRKQIIETYEAYVSTSLEQIISIYRNL
jgi:glycosyltransferase involved in cell wall biosynthesis